VLTFEEAGETKLGEVRDRDEAEKNLKYEAELRERGTASGVSCWPIMVEN
jgi:hypothetical protein